MEYKNYQSLRLYKEKQCLFIVMNRPETRNAFDEIVISELSDAIKASLGDDDIRMLILTGEGTAFSAGANIDWMRRMGEANYEDNLKDANALADMLNILYNYPKPTIAKVNGPAIGGGTGLIAACDIAIAVDTTFFSFSEVKIGLVPACIAPYVVEKVGLSTAKELFISGRRFDAAEAKQNGLVNFVTSAEEFDKFLSQTIKQIATSGPEAIRSAKILLKEIKHLPRDEFIAFTARMIANLRMSEEGQEGISAFLNKRKPRWAVE